MFKTQTLKYALVLFLALCYKISPAQMRSASWLTKTDTAFVPKEIEDPECIGINKQPACHLNALCKFSRGAES